MINRILIRIKVVQTLYSYMLTRSEFHIESAPSGTSRDRRFAYSIYLDTLLLILKLSGQRLTPSDIIAAVEPVGDSKRRLNSSKIVDSLINGTELQVIAAKNGRDLNIYKDCLQKIHDEITSSEIFGTYSRKRSRDIADDIELWSTLVETLFARNEDFINAARQDEDFTIKGFNDGLDMVVETLKKYSDSSTALEAAKRQLQFALEQSALLYHALIALPSALTRMRREQLDAAKEKYLPSADDLNPNTRFVNNLFVAACNDNEELAKFFKEHPFSWEPDFYLLRQLLDRILDSQLYHKYMKTPAGNYDTDCEFWRNVMKDIIFPSDQLAEALEGRSVYWNDDLYVIGSFVLKTIRRVSQSPDGELHLMPEFKDEEDERFGPELLEDTIKNSEEYRELINRFIDPQRWDTDRLALIDVVIILSAIAEILNFPSIPVAVSINEYVEIANYYGNNGSGQFVNGILYSVITALSEEGRLQKPLS